ncbi:hypothetical protein HAX54_028414 [Datura stramonium]|uniref:Uncharacterized protein n=1 Tax=Datura stramonium TaxID=4076 RepID=A0ABS8V4E1_DATST|nr:hypothetical protein [Datura stramonium]
MVIAAAYSFVRRVKSHPQIYGHFVRVMSGYATGKFDVPTVVSELETLFQSHSDLLTGYSILLPPEFRVSSPSQQSRKSRVSNADVRKLTSCIDFMNKLHKRFGDERGVILAYLKTIRAFTKGRISNKEAYDLIAKIFGDENQDLLDEFELHLGVNGGRKKIKKKKKTAGGKSNKEEENNFSSTSPSNSGEEIKTQRQKTLGDLNLSMRMEDEMFELDIHLSHVRTTVQSARALMEILTDSATQQHQTININKYFSALSLSCIRKEYKELGWTIIERLREDPKYVLPQILSRLEPKEEELVESRGKLHKRWCEALEQKQNSMTISS